MSEIHIRIYGNPEKDSVAIDIGNDQSEASKYEQEIHNAIVDMIEAFIRAHKRFNSAAQKSKVYPIVKQEGGARRAGNVSAAPRGEEEGGAR